jgi:uncharacterized repeat protein (TIGR01451 family)
VAVNGARQSNTPPTNPNAGSVASTALPCVPNLSTSDKDVIQVNGQNNTLDSPCNNTSDKVKFDGFTTFNSGDIIKFQINICNSGQANATAVSAVDTMTHLVNPQNFSYSGCGAGATESITVLNPDTTQVDFSFPSLTLGFSPPGVCTVTFEATAQAPGGSTSPAFRFQNKAVITGSPNLTKTVSTPLFLFGDSPKVPNRKEVAP